MVGGGKLEVNNLFLSRTDDRIEFHSIPIQSIPFQSIPFHSMFYPMPKKRAVKLHYNQCFEERASHVRFEMTQWSTNLILYRLTI